MSHRHTPNNEIDTTWKRFSHYWSLVTTPPLIGGIYRSQIADGFTSLRVGNAELWCFLHYHPEQTVPILVRQHLYIETVPCSLALEWLTVKTHANSMVRLYLSTLMFLIQYSRKCDKSANILVLSLQVTNIGECVTKYILHVRTVYFYSKHPPV